jgi:hypothetical protein
VVLDSGAKAPLGRPALMGPIGNLVFRANQSKGKHATTSINNCLTYADELSLVTLLYSDMPWGYSSSWGLRPC